MAIRELNIKPSSNIKQVVYDPDQQTLQITFHAGSTYAYSGVTENDAAAFESADSAGRHLHAVIKPSFPCNKIG